MQGGIQTTKLFLYLCDASTRPAGRAVGRPIFGLARRHAALDPRSLRAPPLRRAREPRLGRERRQRRRQRRQRREEPEVRGVFFIMFYVDFWYFLYFYKVFFVVFLYCSWSS